MIFVTVVTLLKKKSGLPLLLPRHGLWGGVPGAEIGRPQSRKVFRGRKRVYFSKSLTRRICPAYVTPYASKHFFAIAIDLFPYIKE